MMLRQIYSITLLLATISCGGGGGGEQPPASNGGSGGSGGESGPTVPQSLFFEGCADVTCSEKKLAQVNTEVANSFSLIASTEYNSTSSGTRSVEYLNNKVYFSANTIASANFQLWVYNPLAEIEAGINPKDISTEAVGDISFSPQNFKAAGNILYFSAVTPAAGRELWKFDSTMAASATNPSLVVDLEPGTVASNPNELLYHNNKLYFVGETTAHGIELRVYDSALPVNGSNPAVAETRVGSDDGFAKDLSLIGNIIYYSAWDGVDNGTTHGIETWVLDTGLSISASNPSLEVDFEDSSLIAGSLPEHFSSVDSFVYFTAKANGEGSKLRKYDPALAVSAGTNPITIEIESSAGGAIDPPNIRDIHVIGNKLFFNVEDTAGNGDELWIFDTTLPASTSNPQEVFNLEVGGSSSPKILGSYGGIMVLEATTTSYGKEVWIYDTNLPVNIGTNPFVIDTVAGAGDSLAKNLVKSF